MRTRTNPAIKASDTDISGKTMTAPKVQLGPETSNPPLLFILPDESSPEARIISIKNPRYSSEDRYFVCPKNGIYEFTKMAAPKTSPRSWLLSSITKDCSISPKRPITNREESPLKGYVARMADLFIATPMDPLFLILPALNPPSKASEPPRKLFLSSDDYLERLCEGSPQLLAFMKDEGIRSRLEGRMQVVCEAVEAGDEIMYRWSDKKLLQELLRKAEKMVQLGLPASMEEKLIAKTLEVPMPSIKREDSSMQELTGENEAGELESVGTSDSQTTNSIAESSTSFSEVSTAATSFTEVASDEFTNIPKPEISQPHSSTPAGITELLRLRTALLFICSNYIAPYISAALKKVLVSSDSPIDFKPLDTYLTHLARLRQEAMASRSLGDYSRKRGLEDDDETIEIRAEKKRKKEEEEKRKKAGVSVGLRKLQKVNTSGMKKMSDFFKRK